MDNKAWKGTNIRHLEQISLPRHTIQLTKTKNHKLLSISFDAQSYNIQGDVLLNKWCVDIAGNQVYRLHFTRGIWRIEILLFADTLWKHKTNGMEEKSKYTVAIKLYRTIGIRKENNSGCKRGTLTTIFQEPDWSITTRQTQYVH